MVVYRNRILRGVDITIEIIGALIASLTVYRYPVIVRGVLGLTVIFLLYREYVVVNSITIKNITKGSSGVKFEFPKDLKYIVVNFLAVIFMVWSCIQVLELIRYILRIFTR